MTLVSAVKLDGVIRQHRERWNLQGNLISLLQAKQKLYDIPETRGKQCQSEITARINN